MNALLPILESAPGGRYAWFEIDSDSMAPTLRRGDRVVADLFQDRWSCDALYMIALPDGTPVPRRLQLSFPSGMHIRCDNGVDTFVSEDRIPEVIVVGRIIATLRPAL